jgi:ADP-ribose pyrophosphatase YjhB (NUDIX family)
MLGSRPRSEKIFIRGILFRNGKVLLIKNIKNEKYMLPGGVMGEYETVEEAFKKAIKNDIGLENVKLGNFVNMWSFQEIENNIDCYFSVLDFEFSSEEDNIKLGDKYSAIKWISEEEIEDEAMEDGQKKTLKKYFALQNKK